MSADPQTDHLLTEPIPVLVRRLSVPASIGLFFQNMYNIVDNWAAGLISTTALAALSASFSVFFLVIAVSYGSSVATSALIGHAIGRRDADAVCRLTGQALFFSLWMSVLVGAFGYWISPFLFDLMGTTGEVKQLAVNYVRIIFLATPFFVLSSTMNGLLTAHGDARPFRNSLIVGFLLNIGLDWWFVFGGLGLPALGFDGIALATALLQVATLAYMALCCVQKGILRKACWTQFRPQIDSQRTLAIQGFPAMANMLTIALGLFVFARFAAGLGEPVLAALGLGMRIESIALLPMIGLSTPALALVSHSYGAKRLDRLREAALTCYKDGFTIAAVGIPLVWLSVPTLLRLFTSDPLVVEIGVRYQRIAIWVMPAFVILFISTSALQGMQRPMFAIWMGLFRQALMPMLLIPLFLRWMSPPDFSIWWGGFWSVYAGAALTIVYMRVVWQKVQQECRGCTEAQAIPQTDA